LVILPWAQGNDKVYLGDWTIDDVVSDSQLHLTETYYANPVSNTLRYVVGDQDRVINGSVYTADISAADGSQNYETDENGIAKLIVTYDPPLVGHTYSVGVNSYSRNFRSGVASRVAFRGIGYDWSVAPATVTIDGNMHYVDLTISIKPSGDWLDGVSITPQSVTFDSGQCTLNIGSSDLNVQEGHVRIAVDTQVVTDGDKECAASWNPSNSSLYYEY